MELGLYLLILTVSIAGPVNQAVATPARPLVIAHRGASGYLPEHTLAAYQLAIDQGADYIEPDLVMSKDAVLIARHENEISETTDVATVFPNRKVTKVIDGMPITGWFTEDFTVAELKTLKARERLAFRNQTNNGRHEVPSFREVLELVTKESKRLGRPIGVYPETKHPAYFSGLGLNMEEKLLGDLQVAKLDHETAPVFIQSFETENLRILKTKTKVRLVQLMDTSWRAQVAADPEVFQRIAQYAAGVGPNKALIFDAPLKFVERAKTAGLKVHAWTFRDERVFIAKNSKADPDKELEMAFAAGVDGVFSDFPDRAIKIRNQFLNNTKQPPAK
jgi:glycerophosphoryl diester phosphodiesterase